MEKGSNAWRNANPATYLWWSQMKIQKTMKSQPRSRTIWLRMKVVLEEEDKIVPLPSWSTINSNSLMSFCTNTLSLHFLGCKRKQPRNSTKSSRKTQAWHWLTRKTFSRSLPRWRRTYRNYLLQLRSFHTVAPMSWSRRWRKSNLRRWPPSESCRKPIMLICASSTNELKPI